MGDQFRRAQAVRSPFLLRLTARGRWRLDNPGRLQPGKAENTKLYKFCQNQHQAYRNEAALKAGRAAICDNRMPAERQQASHPLPGGIQAEPVGRQKLEQMPGGFDFAKGPGSGSSLPGLI